MTSNKETDVTTTHLGTSNAIININNLEISHDDEPAVVEDTIDKLDESFFMVVAGLLDLSLKKASPL